MRMLSVYCHFPIGLALRCRLPAGEHPLEACLLALLDGPLGDAVAALPSAQRDTQAFAELAATAAGTLGTAVLRHRMAFATAEGGEDAAAAAAAAAARVTAMRALRRFMAALLPEEEEEAEGGSSSGKDSESSSSSSGSESDDDQPMVDKPAGLHNPAVAEAAVQLLQRLLGHSRFLPAMRAAAASPPPLPAAAEAVARPLASLLPLAVAADSPAEPAGPDTAADLKKELCELIETLLDLHQQYSSGGDGAGGSASSAAAQQAQQVAAAEAALLPLLTASYGASCSPTDAAVWSLAAAINQRQWQREQQERRGHGQDSAGAAVAEAGDSDMAALAALLHGPLARSRWVNAPLSCIGAAVPLCPALQCCHCCQLPACAGTVCSPAPHCCPAALLGAPRRPPCSSCRPWTPPLGLTWARRSVHSGDSCCSSACRSILCVQHSRSATGPRRAALPRRAAAASRAAAAAAAVARGPSPHSCLAARQPTTLASCCPFAAAACGSSCWRLVRLLRLACSQVCWEHALAAVEYLLLATTGLHACGVG